MAAEGPDAKPIRVAILGASGYTGAELVRMLLSHTGVEITVLTGNTQAGQPFSTVYPQFHYAKVDHAPHKAEGRVARENIPPHSTALQFSSRHRPGYCGTCKILAMICRFVSCT